MISAIIEKIETFESTMDSYERSNFDLFSRCINAALPILSIHKNSEQYYCNAKAISKISISFLNACEYLTKRNGDYTYHGLMVNTSYFFNYIDCRKASIFRSFLDLKKNITKLCDSPKLDSKKNIIKFGDPQKNDKVKITIKLIKIVKNVFSLYCTFWPSPQASRISLIIHIVGDLGLALAFSKFQSHKELEAIGKVIVAYLRFEQSKELSAGICAGR